MLNRDQTLPLGALHDPPIRLKSAMLAPFRTGHTETPIGNVLPFTVTVLPGTATVALEAHKAYGLWQMARDGEASAGVTTKRARTIRVFFII